MSLKVFVSWDRTKIAIRRASVEVLRCYPNMKRSTYCPLRPSFRSAPVRASARLAAVGAAGGVADLRARAAAGPSPGALPAQMPRAKPTSGLETAATLHFGTIQIIKSNAQVLGLKRPFCVSYKFNSITIKTAAFRITAMVASTPRDLYHTL